MRTFSITILLLSLFPILQVYANPLTWLSNSNKNNNNNDQSDPSPRRVLAWAPPANMLEAAAQLKNKTHWAGIFDGIIANCGIGFAPLTSISDPPPYLSINQTRYNNCIPLLQTCSELNLPVEQWLNGGPPQLVIDAPSHFQIDYVKQVVEEFNQINNDLKSKYAVHFRGLSIDDETDCAPRSTLLNFTLWTSFMTLLNDDLANYNLTLSNDVQALFGIQDWPYESGQACKYVPWQYDYLPIVSKLLKQSGSEIIVMDTYYFDSGRFLDALNYYVSEYSINDDNTTNEKLIIGLSNRDDLSPLDRAIRMNALMHSPVRTLCMFDMPIQDEWLQWLIRWKNNCNSCPGPNKGILSCFQPDVIC